MSFDMNDLSYQALNLPDEVKMYHYSGDFAAETACIERWLARDVSEAMRKRLEIQKLFAETLLHDYQLSAEDMVNGIRERYPSADASTLDALIAFGNVDYILRSGKRCFQHKALSNIFLTHTDYLEKTFNSAYKAPEASAFDNGDIRLMKQNGGRTFRYEVEEKIWLEPAAERPGEMLRIWFPYPVSCATQPESEIRLLSSSHPVSLTGTVHRTAYMEVPCEPGAVYTVRFSFVNRAAYHNLSDHIESNIPVGEGLTAEELTRYTSEQYPHIRFTPFMRELAAQVTAGITDPLIRARKIYDWICSHVTYSYVRDYLLIENIPEFVLTNGYGDCGTMALAFITLCRVAGIPAKWQSGSSCRPNHIGSHDWAMFYVAPYGWLYCDPSYGVGAFGSGNEERRNHYFGNLDPFRLVASNEFQQQTTPPKVLCRMDPYDNQNGEAEYADGVHNIFYDSFCDSRSVLSWEEIPYTE